jgi:hypothetical protein
MATNETSQKEHDDFAAAFHGAEPVQTEQTEDEAFGLSSPAEQAEGDGGQDESTESPTEAQAEAANSGADGGAGEEGGAPAVAIVLEPTGDASGDGPTDPKDIQREKSWEGRLKAKEAELKAREDALNKAKPAESPAEVAADGDTPAEEVAESPAAEAMEEAAEKVQSGELTAEQAMAQLEADFGPEFGKAMMVLIKAQAAEIARSTADEKIGQVDQKLTGIVGEIKSDRERQHFEAISNAHPDFIDVGQSPEFKAYIDALDETQKASAMQTIEVGTSRQIIKLLSAYKDSTKADPAPQPDAVDQQAVDAAEGVRSRGLKLPEKPKASQGYEDAWNEF